MSEKTNNWNALIVALLGLVGVLVAALIGLMGSQRAATELSISATMTAETRQSLTSIPTAQATAIASDAPPLPMPEPIVENQPGIETLTHTQLAGLFQVPQYRIIRMNVAKVEILDFPLKPEYQIDEYGYIVSQDGERANAPLDDLMDIDKDVWQKFLGPVSWTLPTSSETGYCTVGIWAGGGNGEWSGTLRFAQSGALPIKMEAAPRAWITCSPTPVENWACIEAQMHVAEPDVPRYCWDESQSNWLRIR